MKLYFGNAVATATTLMILALLGFIGWSVFNRVNISCWGRRSAAVLIFGLAVCCFAAARDGLDKTIQNAIDGSCTPGLFPLVSIPTIVGCVGALLIIIAAIATPTRQNAARARDMVLYDVGRRCTENRDDGDCTNDSLKEMKSRDWWKRCAWPSYGYSDCHRTDAENQASVHAHSC